MSRPRIRTFKPEMFQDESFGTLSREARGLFFVLLSLADDEGRLRAQSAMVIGHGYPYDDDVTPRRLAGWMDELEGSRIILRYEHAGKAYAAFRHFGRHQKVNKPKTSELPAPPDPVVVRDNYVPQSGSNTGGLPDDDSSPAQARGSDPFLDPDPDPKLEDDARTARELFEYWQQRCEHPQAKPTRERLAKVRSRLREGYTAEQIRAAIDGAARAAFVNDAGKRFDDLELICRNGSKLEDFIARPATNNGRRGAGPTAAEFIAAGREA